LPLTPEQVDGLDVALNEADWHALSVDEPGASVDVLLAVLSRDEAGAEAADPRRTLRLTGVSRLAASYRAGTRDDLKADVLPLDLDGLAELLRRHGGGPVYGWAFVDADGRFREWGDRLSLDLPMGGPGGHHLTLFQDLGGVHHLDLRVWFAELSVLDGDGHRLDLDEVIAGGRRWWEAMYAGERSDQRPGILPLEEPRRRRWWPLFRRTAR